ncbi:unnamed protein product [Urochloa decumbens]|uniref:Uncharacterized protein n=1 Tax=Urochloa decumbens TaxID=240449 RepID=A0ABC9BE93_9POAL
MSRSKGTTMAPVPPLGSSSAGPSPMFSSTASNQAHGQQSSSGAKGWSSSMPATGTPNKPNQQMPQKPRPAPQSAGKKAIPKAKGISSHY